MKVVKLIGNHYNRDYTPLGFSLSKELGTVSVIFALFKSGFWKKIKINWNVTFTQEYLRIYK